MDLYDDVISAPPATGNAENEEVNHQPAGGGSDEANGNFTGSQVTTVVNTPAASGRRHQLYVGNLTWVSIKLF